MRRTCPRGEICRPWTVAILGLGILILAACRGAAPAIDIDALRAEGRILDSPVKRQLTWGTLSRNPEGASPFTWSGHGAEIRRETCGTLFERGSRLVVDIEDDAGHLTPFMIDTGSSITTVSTAAPLAARLSVHAKSVIRMRERGNGRAGRLSTLHAGSLTGRGAAVALIPALHSLNRPTNIMGMDLLWTLVLRHRDGKWSLINANRATPDPAHLSVPLQAPGLPLVTLVSESGGTVHGLIDTGAPKTHAVTDENEGTYALFAADGRRLVSFETRDSVDWRGLRVGGYAVSVLIGLDVLASLDFDLDPGAGVWRVTPAR
jgi:hypothetical protein